MEGEEARGGPEEGVGGGWFGDGEKRVVPFAFLFGPSPCLSGIQSRRLSGQFLLPTARLPGAEKEGLALFSCAGEREQMLGSSWSQQQHHFAALHHHLHIRGLGL